MNNEVKKLKWVDLSLLCLLHKYYDCYWLTQVHEILSILSFWKRSLLETHCPIFIQSVLLPSSFPYFHPKFYIPSLNSFIKISPHLCRYISCMVYFRINWGECMGNNKLIRTQLSYQLAHIVGVFTDFMCDHEK